MRALKQGDGDRQPRAWYANLVETEISGSKGATESRPFLLEKWVLPGESRVSETEVSKGAPAGCPEPGADGTVESGFLLFWVEKGVSPYHLQALTKSGFSFLVPGGVLVSSVCH